MGPLYFLYTVQHKGLFVNEALIAILGDTAHYFDEIRYECLSNA
jgi:hypothetical protein